MGQEIVYCSHCQLQLRGRDFEAGRAFRLDSRACCLNCAPEVMKSLPAAAVQDLLRQMTGKRPPPTESSTRAHPVLTSSSTLTSTVASRSPAPAASPGLLAGLGVGVVVVVILVVAITSSGPAREPRTLPSSSPPREVSVPPPPPRDPLLPAEAAPRRPLPGADPLRTARDYARSNPVDFAGQTDLYQSAVDGLRNSPAQEEAKRELEAVRKTARERIAAELGTLDPRTRDLCSREEFDAALEALEAARRRLNAAEWSTAITQRSDGVRRQASELFASVKEKALDARRRGAADEMKSIQDRVARWGTPAIIAELAALLAEKPSGAPEAKSAAPPPEALAWARCRDAAFRHASARDYASAAAELKRGMEGIRDAALQKAAAEDQELLRQASLSLKEAQQTFLKASKGQTLSLEFIAPDGSVERADGSVVRTDPYRVELKRGGDSVILPLGELRVSGMASVYAAARGTLSAAESRSLALLCLLDGDPKAARSFAEATGAALPDRYWERTPDAVAASEAREQEARTIFHSAERNYETPASTAESAQMLAALLKSHEDTAFVRRNRELLQVHGQGGKDYFFFPEDMVASGSFTLLKNPKTDTSWSSEADSDPAKTKDNFVDITFSAVPGSEYRCWVYAGGCCAETFGFSVQGTELIGPSKEPCEPGGGAFTPAKISQLSLKKTHAQHTGPKGPTRWEWISIPLPKYGAGGPKQIRFLTNQQGFSIAYVAVSAVRQGSPREGESKALEKLRMETPGARALNRGTAAPAKKAPSNDVVVLFALNIEGAQKPAGLSTGSVDKAPDRPANRYCMVGEMAPNGSGRIYLGIAAGFCTFEGDEVLSFDYWVDSTATVVNFNIYNRTQQKNHSGAVEKVVTGKWTHATVRVAELGGSGGETSPRPGDNLGGFYIQAMGGGSAPKFYLDNLQFTRPRAKK